MVKDERHTINVDSVRGHLKNAGERDYHPDFYNRYVKKLIDILLSYLGLILLSPVFLLIVIAIKIDDSGPVLFTQKRVGKNKQYFKVHKFRTMKTSAPHDVPTHRLENPEQYITKVGRFLRQTSLDELPQLWDIFRGQMSFIGPRPALWNQEDLVAERDKYDANRVMPGLTGLAQIRGRDKLLISDKAFLDGEYVRILRQGGMKAFGQDIYCFLYTVRSVISHEGVVEGGTGSLLASSKNSQAVKVRRISLPSVEEAGFEDYGYKKSFHIDKNAKRKVLITGAGSYIGESFKSYCKDHYSNIEIETVDMIDETWREKSFEGFDTILHVAGIAHVDVGSVPPEQQKKYYEINTDLAIETAKKAKADGVKQFIFMSSMTIYGKGAFNSKWKIIDEHTVPAPANFYGDSKWLADKGVRKLNSPDFHVAVLRPPMIYGKNCKGNYIKLAKLAKMFPVFPDIENRRSMLYIENLCEFLALLTLSGESGIYFPQNSDYVKTADMVQIIGEITHKPVKNTKMLNPVVNMAKVLPGKAAKLANKAFGSLYYEQKLSIYDGLDYQRISLKESIKRTEKADTTSSHRKRILILVNHEVVIYNFRLELVERLLAEGYEIHISTPPGERIEELSSLGAICHDIEIDRHGMNPMKEAKILREYNRLVKEVKPIVILGFTIKPNIYGAMSAQRAHVPFIANITGLGTAVEKKGFKQRLTVFLYKIAFGSVQRVFFQNEENEEFFKKQNIAISKHILLPGSGVNLKRYPATPLPACGNGRTGSPIKFAFISRIMKEKGIEEYLEMAVIIKKEYPSTEFHVCGFSEAEYNGRLEQLNEKGIIQYHGMIRDVAGFMSQMHCIVHPSYYPEGLSNVLLEASACGRAIITCDRSGCREVVENNGFLVPEKNTEELVKAIRKFIALDYKQKVRLGISGRELVEKKFDRRIVVNAYMNEVNKLVI